MVVGRATQSSKPTTWRTADSALGDAATRLPGNPKTAPSVVRPRVCVSTFCPAGRFPAVLTNTHMNSTQNLKEKKKRPGCRCDNRKWPSPSWPAAQLGRRDLCAKMGQSLDVWAHVGDPEPHAGLSPFKSLLFQKEGWMTDALCRGLPGQQARVLMGGPSPDEAANRRARPMLNDSISSLFFLWSPTSFFLCFCMHASLCALPRVFLLPRCKVGGPTGRIFGITRRSAPPFEFACSHRSVTTVQDDAHQARHTLSVDRLVVLLSVVWLVCVPRLLSPSRRGTGIKANG